MLNLLTLSSLHPFSVYTSSFVFVKSSDSLMNTPVIILTRFSYWNTSCVRSVITVGGRQSVERWRPSGWVGQRHEKSRQVVPPRTSATRKEEPEGKDKVNYEYEGNVRWCAPPAPNKKRLFREHCVGPMCTTGTKRQRLLREHSLETILFVERSLYVNVLFFPIVYPISISFLIAPR